MKYWVRLVITIFSLGLAFSGLASELSKKFQIPLETLGALPTHSMMSIAPSGTKFSYRVTNKDHDALVIYDLKARKQLGGIQVNKIDPHNIYFIDEERLIFVASEYKRAKGYRYKRHISTAFVFNIKTQEYRQLLVNEDSIHPAQTGLGRIVGISPDGKYAFMPAYMKDASIYQNEAPRFALLKVNLEKKSPPKRLNRGFVDARDYFVDERGELLARVRYNNTTDIFKVESRISGEWEVIHEEETPIPPTRFAGLTPDRQSLVMKSGVKGRAIYSTMSLVDGTITDSLFAREDADVEYVLTDINRIVYGVRYSGFKPSYAFFDPKLNELFKAIQEVLPNNTFNLVDHTPNWKSIIFQVEGEGLASEYFRYANGKFSPLISARPGISPELVNPVQVTEYKARDELTIPTLLTAPGYVKKLKNLPAILLPHGGPEAYDRIHFDWLAQYFASRGYLVIQPQFRGSTGFGFAFQYKGRGEWGRKMQDDLTDAVHHFSEKGIIDPERVCIVGASYGGYAALAGATFTPDLYRCAISIAGVSDLEEMVEENKRSYGSDHWVLSYWKQVIENENVEADLLKKISPINHVEKVKAPILLIHGEDDKRVPYKQSSTIYDELKGQDKEVTLVELEDEGHYLKEPESRVKILKSIDAFLKKYG